MADSGGSTGRLREAFDIPPVGDLRHVLTALIEDTPWKNLLEYRFDSERLDHHNLGNLIFTASLLESSDITEATKDVCDRFSLPHSILPVTNDIHDLVIGFEDGSTMQ